jgi:hypothetical protein
MTDPLMPMNVKSEVFITLCYHRTGYLSSSPRQAGYRVLFPAAFAKWLANRCRVQRITKKPHAGRRKQSNWAITTQMKQHSIPTRLFKLGAAGVILAACLVLFHIRGHAAGSSNEVEPPVIDPGLPGGPPSDAVVLFDGKDLSKWKSVGGGEAKWKNEDGILIVGPGTGNIMTTEEFGDVQVHVEWAAPSPATGQGQDRGNSGVYLEGRYEIQVLDCYDNKTYFNGQTAAFYGHSAPLVNACRKPGEWQTYDIIFHAPKPLANGAVKPGSFTVLHNGVLVQDHVPVQGEATTSASFNGVSEKGPLVLQDHGHPVRFRNIWVRRL